MSNPPLFTLEDKQRLQRAAEDHPDHVLWRRELAKSIRAVLAEVERLEKERDEACAELSSILVSTGSRRERLLRAERDQARAEADRLRQEQGTA